MVKLSMEIRSRDTGIALDNASLPAVYLRQKASMSIDNCVALFFSFCNGLGGAETHSI
jgi:hypothetical protein